MSRTQTTVVLRRGDDYLTVSVEADVTLHRDTVEVSHCSYWEAFEESAGVFPVTQREYDMFERALEEEAAEDARETLPFYFDHSEAA